MTGLLERYISSISRWFAVAGLCLLLLLAAATLLDGMLRWTVGRTIDGVRDFGGLLIATAVVACIPQSLASRSHATVRALSSLMGPRAVAWFDCAADFIMCFLLFLFATQYFVYSEKLAQAGDATWLLNLPVAPFWYAVSAILLVSVLVQAGMLLLSLIKVASPSRSASDTDSSHRSRSSD
ncbi:MAG: TRAP transporter small permease subunit [Pirellulales bacterium]